MKKSFSIIFATIFLLIITNLQPSAYGMSCKATTLGEQYDSRDIVFVGKVISKEYFSPLSFVAISTFEVEEVIKGSQQEQVLIYSDEGYWGKKYIEGHTYIIFAHNYQDMYTAGWCGLVIYAFPTTVEQIRSLQDENSPIRNEYSYSLDLTDEEKKQRAELGAEARIINTKISGSRSNLIFQVFVILSYFVIGGMTSLIIWGKRLRKKRLASKIMIKNESVTGKIIAAENIQWSSWWYVVPVLLGIVGGIIAYFLIRHDDKVKAKNCLIIGIVLGIFLSLFPILGMIGILTYNI